jgi:DNA-directed RNA polymerase specialized sigma24 family protein
VSWGLGNLAYADGRAHSSDAVELRRLAPDAAPEQLDLETVYRIRRPEMIRYLVRFGVDLVEAEDVTQEVFLHVLDPAKRDKQPDNLFRWALTCAKNLAIDRYRRGRKELLAPASLWKQWEETLPDAAASAETLMSEKDGQLPTVP